MNDERTLPPDDERRIEELLRTLPEPAPDAEFRARLRHDFAAGSVARTLGDAPGGTEDLAGTSAVPPFASHAEVPEGPDAAPGRTSGPGTPTPGFFPPAEPGRPSPGRGVFPEDAPTSQPPRRSIDFGSTGASRGRPGFWRWLAPSFAAAAVVLLYFLRPVPPTLEVAALGGGHLRIDGRTYPIGEVGTYRDLLRPGASLLVEGDASTELRFRVADDFTLAAIPGAEFTVPQPARSGRAAFRVTMGEVRVATLPGIAGEAVEIEAPGTRVDVMGTTLAVIADTASTCVCLLEGTAMMMSREGAMMPLDPGMRRIMHMDPARPDETAPIHGNERMKLEMLRSAVGPAR